MIAYIGRDYLLDSKTIVQCLDVDLLNRFARVGCQKGTLGEWVSFVRLTERCDCVDVKKITIEQFAYFTYRTTGVRPVELRLSQWMFNDLHAEFPEIARPIVGTDCDSFYVDARIPEFLKRVLDFVEV